MWRSQTSDKMDRWKSKGGKSQRRESKKKEDRRRESKKKEDQRRDSQKKEDPGARKGRKVAKHCVFPLILGSGGLNSRLAKAAGAERLKIARRCRKKHMSKPKCTKHTILGPLLEVDVSKKCTPLWREAHLEVKKLKTPHARTIFEGSDVVLWGSRKEFCT